MTISKIVTGPGREIEASVFGKPGTVLLESIRRDDENSLSYLFRDPVAVIQCTSADMVPSCIEQIEKATGCGLYAAGFIGYEAGSVWASRDPDLSSSMFPFLWFGLYDKVERFESPLLLPASRYSDEPIDHLLDISSDRYEDRVRTILQFIRNGDTYQVNFTARSTFLWRYGTWELYLRLRRSQPVPYGAFLNCGRFSIVSLSPELFLSKCGNMLRTRPMKGTAPRGSDRESDQQIAEWLRSDPKNLAENLMIVDLMRNDLGKVSEIGKVHVHDPFRVEPYTSLFQMTSGISCRVRDGVGIGDVLKATFPPGSVTGAPKISTMRIISDLENTCRKVYTGAIGYLDPKGDFTFNVAIRTITSTASGSCEMGLGSGIVSDSVPEDEYREVALKARFLDPPSTDQMDLFETILLEEDGNLLWLDEHLQRMENSASVLGLPFRQADALTSLDRQLGKRAAGPAIVRLILTATGDFSVELFPLVPLGEGRKRVVLSHHRTDQSDRLLYHKTTLRQKYDRELAEARENGFVEILFSNTSGYITEGAITNLFILGSSGWVTPSVRCGLLPGIWRRKFFHSTAGAEVFLTRDDLSAAERVVIGNSVRGDMVVDEVVDTDGKVLYMK